MRVDVAGCIGPAESGNAVPGKGVRGMVTAEGRSEPGVTRVCVRGVSPRLFIAFDDYLGELLRELQLIRVGRASGLPSHEPRRLLELVDEVTQRHADKRAAARGQAEAALAAGQEDCTIEFDLPFDAALDVQRFAPAIEQLPALGATGHLLTLPPSPEVVAFAHAWIRAILDQLTSRRNAPGASAPQAPAPASASSGLNGGLNRDSTAGGVQAGGSFERSRGDDAQGTPPAAELALPADPSAPSHVRRWLRSVLAARGMDAIVDQALLPATELVTNAVLHARTPVTVALEVHPDAVRVEVRDECPVLPAAHHAQPDAATGRGLALLAAMTDGWGVRSEKQGKAVWFELRPFAHA